MSPQVENDHEMETVVANIRLLDPDGRRTARIIRETFDQLYDGQRTGRYQWEQLYKTEKTHCGTLIEINLNREFKFESGDKLDYKIAGIEVDCKYSQSIGGWMIPPEAHGHLCLLVSAEDSDSPKWSMGFVRITDDRLNTGGNRDKKATLNTNGRNAIIWLFKDEPMSPNALLQIDRTVVEGIMALAQKSGQKAINELFRRALGLRIGRTVVATVAQQNDYMKRLRANGGARTALQSEGIIILGQYESHKAVARELGVPIPGPGEAVSVRVVPAAPGVNVAKIEGRLWRVAQSDDHVIPAPKLPDT